jgi:carboxyl-terminal processing protease
VQILQDEHRRLVLQLGPETALRLTTARYFTPSGRSVQEGGIEPDIKVPQLTDPDYKSRPVFREADLRKHLINEVKADNAVLEEDTKTDPRFSQTPDQLKKQGIDDFQLYYALKTVARLGGPVQVAAATKPRPIKPDPTAAADAAKVPNK